VRLHFQIDCTSRRSAHGLSQNFFHTITAFADFAETEIKEWPRTDRLGLTPRTKEILDELVQREEPATNEPRWTERSG
jgi:hypothetical protein